MFDQSNLPTACTKSTTSGCKRVDIPPMALSRASHQHRGAVELGRRDQRPRASSRDSDSDTQLGRSAAKNFAVNQRGRPCRSSACTRPPSNRKIAETAAVRRPEGSREMVSKSEHIAECIMACASLSRGEPIFLGDYRCFVREGYRGNRAFPAPTKKRETLPLRSLASEQLSLLLKQDGGQGRESRSAPCPALCDCLSAGILRSGEPHGPRKALPCDIFGFGSVRRPAARRRARLWRTLFESSLVMYAVGILRGCCRRFGNTMANGRKCRGRRQPVCESVT